MLVALLMMILGVAAIVLDWKINPGTLLRGKVSVTSVYLYFYIVFYLLGGTYLYLSVSQNPVFLLSLCLGLIIPVGLLGFFRVIFKPFVTERNEMMFPSADWRYPRISWCLMAVAMVVSVLGVTWYFINAGIPLISLLMGGAENLRALRRDAVASFDGAYVFRGLFNVVHVMALFFFIRGLSRPTVWRVFWAISWFLGGTLMYLASTEKGPVLLFWSSVVVAYGYQRGNLKLSRFVKGLLLTGTSVYLIVITMMTYGNAFGDAISLVFERIALYQVAGTFYAYELFPKHIDFLLGQSYHLPSFIVPVKFPLEFYLFQTVFGSNSIGNSPPGVMANGYANFGFMFSVAEYMLTFSIFLLMEQLFMRRRDAFGTACRAWLTVYITQLITAGSSAAVILSPGFLLIAVLFFATTGGRPIVNNGLDAVGGGPR